MGVDYYQCTGCSRGFRDDSEYCVFCECGNCYCSEECGKLDNYKEWNEETDSHRVDLEKDVTCTVCRNENYTDYTLLEAVCKHFNITRNQAVDIWRTLNKS